jgi:hypothetical protein
MTLLWDAEPCRVAEVYRHFKCAYFFHHKNDNQALMMEAVTTSGTSVNFYKTARRNIPEDSLLRTRSRKNLKSYHHHHFRVYVGSNAYSGFKS